MALSLKKCYVALTYHPCKDVSEKEEHCVNVSHNHRVWLPTKTMEDARVVVVPALGPHHHACLCYNLITKRMHVRMTKNK
jgi:hypothetical protein